MNFCRQATARNSTVYPAYQQKRITLYTIVKYSTIKLNRKEMAKKIAGTL
jgi:hypothetical protein